MESINSNLSLESIVSTIKNTSYEKIKEIEDRTLLLRVSSRYKGIDDTIKTLFPLYGISYNLVKPDVYLLSGEVPILTLLTLAISLVSNARIDVKEIKIPEFLQGVQGYTESLHICNDMYSIYLFRYMGEVCLVVDNSES